MVAENGVVIKNVRSTADGASGRLTVEDGWGEHLYRVYVDADGRVQLGAERDNYFAPTEETRPDGFRRFEQYELYGRAGEAGTWTHFETPRHRPDRCIWLPDAGYRVLCDIAADAEAHAIRDGSAMLGPRPWLMVPLMFGLSPEESITGLVTAAFFVLLFLGLNALGKRDRVYQEEETND